MSIAPCNSSTDVLDEKWVNVPTSVILETGSNFRELQQPMFSEGSKTLLRNVIRHTDTHNRLLEESDMWRHHSSERDRRKSSNMKSTCRRVPRAHMDREEDIRAQIYQGREAGKQLYEFEEKDPDRWGHSGFKELYPDEFSTGDVPEPEADRRRSSKKDSSRNKDRKENSDRKKKHKREHRNRDKDSRVKSSRRHSPEGDTNRKKRRHENEAGKMEFEWVERSPSKKRSTPSSQKHSSSSRKESSRKLESRPFRLGISRLTHLEEDPVELDDVPLDIEELVEREQPISILEKEREQLIKMLEKETEDSTIASGRDGENKRNSEEKENKTDQLNQSSADKASHKESLDKGSEHVDQSPPDKASHKESLEKRSRRSDKEDKNIKNDSKRSDRKQRSLSKDGKADVGRRSRSPDREARKRDDRVRSKTDRKTDKDRDSRKHRDRSSKRHKKSSRHHRDHKRSKKKESRKDVDRRDKKDEVLDRNKDLTEDVHSAITLNSSGNKDIVDMNPDKDIIQSANRITKPSVEHEATVADVTLTTTNKTTALISPEVRSSASDKFAVNEDDGETFSKMPDDPVDVPVEMEVAYNKSASISAEVAAEKSDIKYICARPVETAMGENISVPMQDLKGQQQDQTTTYTIEVDGDRTSKLLSTPGKDSNKDSSPVKKIHRRRGWDVRERNTDDTRTAKKIDDVCVVVNPKSQSEDKESRHSHETQRMRSDEEERKVHNIPGLSSLDSQIILSPFISGKVASEKRKIHSDEVNQSKKKKRKADSSSSSSDDSRSKSTTRKRGKDLPKSSNVGDKKAADSKRKRGERGDNKATVSPTDRLQRSKKSGLSKRRKDQKRRGRFSSTSESSESECSSSDGGARSTQVLTKSHQKPSKFKSKPSSKTDSKLSKSSLDRDVTAIPLPGQQKLDTRTQKRSAKQSHRTRKRTSSESGSSSDDEKRKRSSSSSDYSSSESDSDSDVRSRKQTHRRRSRSSESSNSGSSSSDSDST